MKKYRDINLMSLNETETLVIACDTSASIGRKPNDCLAVDPEIVGQFATRVVLMEVLSVNAQPQLLVHLCGNEMVSTGQSLLKGIRAELKKAGISDLMITGSTEENMPTSMTSVGLTLIARAETARLKIGQAFAGNKVYQVGLPLVGQALLDHSTEIITYDDLRELKNLGSLICEIVPIGSKGAIDEAQQIAHYNHLSFSLGQDLDQFYQSSGPATSFLIVTTDQMLDKLRQHFKSVEWVGDLV